MPTTSFTANVNKTVTVEGLQFTITVPVFPEGVRMYLNEVELRSGETVTLTANAVIRMEYPTLGESSFILTYENQNSALWNSAQVASGTIITVDPEITNSLEMIGAICHQLTANATPQQMQEAGMDAYYVDHGMGIYPQSAGGVPWNAVGIQSKGDPITDLYEDMAAEQKARSTYEYLLDLIDDPDVADPIKFLREREVVHFQRFGEALNYVRDYMDGKRIFYKK